MDYTLPEIETLLKSDSDRRRSVGALCLSALKSDAEPLIPSLIQVMEQVDCDAPSLDKMPRSIVTFGVAALARYLHDSCGTNPRTKPQEHAAWNTIVRLTDAGNREISHAAVCELGRLDNADVLPILHRVMCSESMRSDVMPLQARAFQSLIRIAPELADSPEYARARTDFAAACFRWSAEYKKEGETEKAIEMENQARRYQAP